jgi:WhiB family redox-sensing transcriptional regulator
MAMVEEPDEGPLQAPTLTELEEARASATLVRQVDLEWLMASDDPTDAEGLLAEFINRPAWHRQAACLGAAAGLFFPERGSGRPEAALAYCESCPVRSPCLASALQESSTKGVWGGTTERERRGLRRVA